MVEIRLLALPHLENLRIGVKRLARGEDMERNFHDHNFSEIVLIQESKDTIHWANGRSCPLTRGDLLLLHPGLQHAYENTRDFALVNLLYDAKKLPLPSMDGGALPLLTAILMPRNSPHPEKPVAHLNEKMIESINQLIVRLEDELQNDDAGKHLCSFGLFITIITLIARAGGSQPASEMSRSIFAALNYINLHFQEKLDTDHLAHLCYLSRAIFFQRFRELTGLTPSAYQRRKRLELAETLLRSSNLSLNVIAWRCGFCDTNHLIKLFSAHYGTPPGRFRRLNADKNSDQK